MKNDRKIIIPVIISLVLIITIGTSYAFFNYTATSKNQELITGNIYMHYTETDKTIDLQNAYPLTLLKDEFISGKYYLNTLMEEQSITEANELTRCINELPLAGITEDTLSEGTTLESFCKGEGTSNGFTLQQLVDHYYVAQGMYNELNYLLSKGILVQEEGNYLVNPVIATQNITELNELSTCIDQLQTYELEDGESYESFCKNQGTIGGLTFKEHQTNQTSLYNDNLEFFLNNNIIEYKDILTEEDLEYFEFTIDGRNEYQEKDIKYEIKLTYGENTTGKTIKLADKYLRFSLVEIKDADKIIRLHDVSYEDLSEVSIYKEEIRRGEEINRTYRLYMWVSNEVKLGNTENATYSLDDWEKVYASIKVNVEGDFLEKTVESPMLPENGAGVIMSKLGTDGLVAINNDGRLYTGEGVIREYRYSGPVVNNYIIFNDDGDSETEANELWRIVGVFKNDAGNWNLKLMRDTILTSEEMPNTYVVNGTSYTIQNSTTGRAYWNNPSTTPTTSYSDWTRAGLQYFLNTERDDNGTAGYLATFTENAKELIDRSYTYYLGNNYWYDDGVNGDTAISSYKN